MTIKAWPERGKYSRYVHIILLWLGLRKKESPYFGLYSPATIAGRAIKRAAWLQRPNGACNGSSIILAA
jgi:hypothetical protein